MVVDPSVGSEMDKTYDKIEASETDSIKDFLSKLANQRDVVLSHNEFGNLVYTRAKTKQTPIITYGGDGGIPCPEMKLTFNGQGMHSHITVMKQADEDGGNSGQSTIRNPYVPYVFRPKTLTQNSGDDIDTDQAAKNALATELKNLRVVINTDRWDIDNKIILPNTTIDVTNPAIYLYKKTRLFVESVDFSGDAKSSTAVINCCVPEAYNGDSPKYLFAGINTH